MDDGNDFRSKRLADCPQRKNSGIFGKALTWLGVAAASPWTLFLILAYSAIWLMFDVRSFDWDAGATLATWLMTVFIQRAEHRDTLAIHAKLDELLIAQDGASKTMTRIDGAEPEEIENIRNTAREPAAGLPKI
jgi:low affinity Fe/Cu permease